jgi:hypothetical protein
MKAEGWVYSATYGPRQGKFPVICLSKYIPCSRVHETSLAMDLQYSQHETSLGFHRRLVHYEEPECNVFYCFTWRLPTPRKITRQSACVILGETNAKCSSKRMNLRVKVKERLLMPKEVVFKYWSTSLCKALHISILQYHVPRLCQIALTKWWDRFES